jgi:hypothetical protein
MLLPNPPIEGMTRALDLLTKSPNWVAVRKDALSVNSFFAFQIGTRGQPSSKQRAQSALTSIRA